MVSSSDDSELRMITALYNYNSIQKEGSEDEPGARQRRPWGPTRVTEELCTSPHEVPQSIGTELVTIRLRGNSSTTARPPEPNYNSSIAQFSQSTGNCTFRMEFQAGYSVGSFQFYKLMILLSNNATTYTIHVQKDIFLHFQSLITLFCISNIPVNDFSGIHCPL